MDQQASIQPSLDPIRNAARAALTRHSFCTLATSSAQNRPHVVGVVYSFVEGRLYVHTFADSRKARNIRANPYVAVCVPVRRVPMAPPFCVQFQATAELLDVDAAQIASLVRSGRLRKIAAHGALEAPGSCIVRITPGPTISTYGIGVPMLTLLRDPLRASRNASWR
ncbi:MAG TPA: pyridoxamine 5'-phosphate oxidase family protein [Candidatus Limnocylindrales bacterium]|nr:pyridoxamine 5'-phosphate oxidase family protein [Candidatus Limnocylindrales bacterium]